MMRSRNVQLVTLQMSTAVAVYNFHTDDAAQSFFSLFSRSAARGFMPGEILVPGFF